MNRESGLYLVQRYLPFASALQVSVTPAAFLAFVPAAAALQNVPAVAVTAPDADFVVAVLGFVVAVVALVVTVGAFVVTVGAFVVTGANVAFGAFVVLVAAVAVDPTSPDPATTIRKLASNRREFIWSW